MAITGTKPRTVATPPHAQLLQAGVEKRGDSRHEHAVVRRIDLRNVLGRLVHRVVALPRRRVSAARAIARGFAVRRNDRRDKRVVQFLKLGLLEERFGNVRLAVLLGGGAGGGGIRAPLLLRLVVEFRKRLLV